MGDLPYIMLTCANGKYHHSEEKARERGGRFEDREKRNGCICE